MSEETNTELEAIKAELAEIKQANQDLMELNKALAGGAPESRVPAAWHEGIDRDAVDESVMDVAARLEADFQARLDSQVGGLREVIEGLRAENAELKAEAKRTGEAAAGAAEEAVRQRHARAVDELYEAVPEFASFKGDEAFTAWSNETDFTSRQPRKKLIMDALHAGDGQFAAQVVKTWPGYAKLTAPPEEKPAAPDPDEALFAAYEALETGLEAPPAPEVKDEPPPDPAPAKDEAPKDTRENVVDLDVRQPAERGNENADTRGAGGEENPHSDGYWTPERIRLFNHRISIRWFERKGPEGQKMKRELMKSLMDHQRRISRAA